MSFIEAKNVSKKFIISHEKDALIRNILPTFFRIKNKEEFWALRDINFELQKGQTLGIIGSNGAGKSTLLNILGGISWPTEGSVKLGGEVSAILSLGAGFHPELTGEENIFLNGSILGMSLKEIEKKFDSIVSFSELNGFIDAPLQTYSAGMILRLGFSIAVFVNFDILLIDEILSVGDLYFQKKCIEKIKEIKHFGKTLVIASQSLMLIKSLADKVLFLDKGEDIEFGSPETIIKSYEKLSERQKSIIIEKDFNEALRSKSVIEDVQKIKSEWGLRFGTKEAEIVEVKLFDKKGRSKIIFKTGDEIQVEAFFIVHKVIEKPHFGIAFFRKDYTYCYGPNTKFDAIKIDRLGIGKGRFSIRYRKLLLLPGEYFISVAIWDEEEKHPYDYHCAFYKLIIKGKQIGPLYQEDYEYKMVDIENLQKKSESGLRIYLRNKYNEEENTFNTEEPFNLIFETSSNRFDESIKIYREDGVFCFEIKNRLILKRTFVKFTILKLHLLVGRYNICVGDKINMANFKVFTEKRDHGVVYMPHKWNIQIS